jgi:hypothetical protein
MTRLDSPTSTHDSSKTMAPIDEAIEELKLREEGEYFSLQEIADKYGVERRPLTFNNVRNIMVEGCSGHLKKSEKAG